MGYKSQDIFSRTDVPLIHHCNNLVLPKNSNNFRIEIKYQIYYRTYCSSTGNIF